MHEIGATAPILQATHWEFFAQLQPSKNHKTLFRPPEGSSYGNKVTMQSTARRRFSIQVLWTSVWKTRFSGWSITTKNRFQNYKFSSHARNSELESIAFQYFRLKQDSSTAEPLIRFTMKTCVLCWGHAIKSRMPSIQHYRKFRQFLTGTWHNHVSDLKLSTITVL